MTVILCLDDKNGIGFHNRRQSRDIALCRDVLNYIGEHTLWVTPYTLALFRELTGDIRTFDGDWEPVQPEDAVFGEDLDPEVLLPHARKLIIYRWNRIYPSDSVFPQELLPSSDQQVEVTEFPGKSHEKITREVYIL